MKIFLFIFFVGITSVCLGQLKTTSQRLAALEKKDLSYQIALVNLSNSMKDLEAKNSKKDSVIFVLQDSLSKFVPTIYDTTQFYVNPIKKGNKLIANEVKLKIPPAQ